jgi:serine/threonine protein kinase
MLKMELSRLFRAHVLVIKLSVVCLLRVTLPRTKKNSLNRELNALRKLSKNPYVVHLHNYEAQTTKKNGVEGFLVMEELPEGYDLFHAAFTFNKITDLHIKPLVIQLLHGLKSIHDTGYIHLDIKPENIHWASDNTIKYLDFGLSQKNPFLT